MALCTPPIAGCLPVQSDADPQLRSSISKGECGRAKREESLLRNTVARLLGRLENGALASIHLMGRGFGISSSHSIKGFGYLNRVVELLQNIALNKRKSRKFDINPVSILKKVI